MKLIKPYVEVWEQNPGMLGIYEQIEKCARVCYKSEDRIGEGTAEKMVEMLKGLNHGAMLEHGTVYLKVPVRGSFDSVGDCWVKWQYGSNPYSIVVKKHSMYYITTNYRVLVEKNWLEDLKYSCEPTEYHEKRITAHFICDRGIMAELTRHRVFSFAVESTRFCNYSKSKFNNGCTFIIPLWLKLPEGYYHLENPRSEIDNAFCYYTQSTIEGERSYHLIKTSNDYIHSLEVAEQSYLNLINYGWTPQQARAVLPNALKTEVCMTGFMKDWEHFFNLRCDKAAHPQMRELAVPLQKLIME